MKVIVKEEVLEVLDLTKEEVIKVVEYIHKGNNIEPVYSLVSFDMKECKVMVTYYLNEDAEYSGGVLITPMHMYKNLVECTPKPKKKASTKKVVKEEAK